MGKRVHLRPDYRILQLHIIITYRVTASTNRAINLYSKYRGNKLQALTKIVVTYEQIELRSYDFCHCARHEQRNELLGKFFSYSSFFTEFNSKIRSSITYNRFDTT